MDKKDILSQLGDMPQEVYDQIACIFYDETRDRLKVMAQAAGAGNWPMIAKIAHSIKGSAANLRLIQIQEAAQGLQDCAQANDRVRVNKSLEIIKLQLDAQSNDLGKR